MPTHWVGHSERRLSGTCAAERPCSGTAKTFSRRAFSIGSMTLLHEFDVGIAAYRILGMSLTALSSASLARCKSTRGISGKAVFVLGQTARASDAVASVRRAGPRAGQVCGIWPRRARAATIPRARSARPRRSRSAWRSGWRAPARCRSSTAPCRSWRRSCATKRRIATSVRMTRLRSSRPVSARTPARPSSGKPGQPRERGGLQAERRENAAEIGAYIADEHQWIAQPRSRAAYGLGSA